jgi:hypothetical protein
MDMRIFRRFAVVLLLLGATSCADATGPDREQLLELADAWGRWRDAGLQDYTMTVGESCECTGGELVRVTVRDGAAVAAVGVRTGTAYPLSGARRFTVEGRFDKILQALGDAHSVTVTYDARYGYPARIGIDWYWPTVDDEIGFYIRDFAVP